jgi:hypothetical protein
MHRLSAYLERNEVFLDATVPVAGRDIVQAGFELLPCKPVTVRKLGDIV